MFGNVVFVFYLAHTPNVLVYINISRSGTLAGCASNLPSRGFNCIQTTCLVQDGTVKLELFKTKP